FNLEEQLTPTRVTINCYQFMSSSVSSDFKPVHSHPDSDISGPPNHHSISTVGKHSRSLRYTGSGGLRGLQNSHIAIFLPRQKVTRLGVLFQSAPQFCNAQSRQLSQLYRCFNCCWISLVIPRCMCNMAYLSSLPTSWIRRSWFS